MHQTHHDSKSTFPHQRRPFYKPSLSQFSGKDNAELRIKKRLATESNKTILNLKRAGRNAVLSSWLDNICVYKAREGTFRHFSQRELTVHESTFVQYGPYLE